MTFAMNPKGARCVVDVFSVGVILLSAVFGVSALTLINYDMYLAVVSIAFVTIIAFSISMGILLKLVVVDWTLRPNELGRIIMMFWVGFFGIVASQYVVLQAASKMSIVDALSRKMFYGSAAIFEEVFFRLLLLTFFLRAKMPAILASLFVSSMFPIYHASVYGIESPMGLTKSAVMLALFINSMVLCYIYIYSTDKKGNHRIIVPMLAHLAVNIVVG